jgi:hypothetical protein
MALETSIASTSCTGSRFCRLPTMSGFSPIHSPNAALATIGVLHPVGCTVLARMRCSARAFA